MTSASIGAWLRQPTTVAGISAITGSIVMLVSDLITGQPWMLAASTFIGGLVAIVLPDNTAAAKPIEQLFVDGVQAATTKHLAEAMPQITADALAAFRALAAPAPTSAAPATPSIPVTTIGAQP